MINLEDTRWIEEVARTTTLSLAPGSMLESLVRPYTLLEVDNLDTAVSIINADEKHEGIMEAMANKLAATMMQRAAYIRNDVSANIEDMFNAISDELDVITTPTLNVQAVRLVPPAAFTGDLLDGVCSNFTNRDIPTFNPEIKWGELTTAEILRGLAATYGNDAMEEIAGIIATSPVSLESIYTKIFRKMPVRNYPVFGVRAAPSYLLFGPIEAALVVFIAHAMINGSFDESIIGTPDGVKVAALKVAIPAAQTLTRAIASTTRDETTNVLVKDILKVDGKTLILMPKTKYDALLGQGGQELVTGLALLSTETNNVESIRGHMREDRQYTVDANLQAKAIDRYKTTVVTARAAAQVNEVSKTRAVMVRVLVRAINAEEINLPVDMSTPTALAAIRSEISKVVVTKRERLYESVRDLMCRALFPNTGALEFLTLIDEVGTQDVGETPNEIATLAAVQLYARWADNQLG